MYNTQDTVQKQELLEGVAREQSVIPEQQSDKLVHDFEQQFLHEMQRQAELDLLLKEREDIIAMRKNWSKWVMVVLAVILFLNFVTIVCVGLQWLTFPTNWTLEAFMLQTLAEVVVLAVIVVKFLFNGENISMPKGKKKGIIDKE